jgi:hypothetical protein
MSALIADYSSLPGVMAAVLGVNTNTVRRAVFVLVAPLDSPVPVTGSVRSNAESPVLDGQPWQQLASASHAERRVHAQRVRISARH